MKRKGFSLIELVVALMIGSIMSVMLYQIFARISRTTIRMNSRIDEYGDIFITSGQLERDMMSIVLLAEAQKVDEKSQKEAKAKEKEEEAPMVASGTAGVEDEERLREERIPFSCVVQEGKLLSLSFVTTNALPQVDVIDARLVRVRYFLKADPDDATLFQLMREEVPYGKETAAVRHAYPLLSRVGSLSFTFYSIIRTDVQDEQRELKFTEWGTQAQKEKLPVAVPEYVTIAGFYYAQSTHEEIPFSVSLFIPAARIAMFDHYEKEKQKKKQEAAHAQKSGNGAV